MIIFPAIDLKNGLCVRLRQGIKDDQTVFSDDPVAVAEEWQAQGAKWLHIVDLDGAFDGMPVNSRLIKKICQCVDIPVQLGGGIRSLEVARNYLDMGVSRLLIGTIAIAEPKIFAGILAAFPGKIGVSLDAKDGKLLIKGWVEDSGLYIKDILPKLEAQGTAFIVYTDINRDGMQQGVNIAALKEVTELSTIPVVAAGGVHNLNDIKNLYPLSCTSTLQGVITGRAIYEKTLDLQEALIWVQAQAVTNTNA